MQPDQQFPQEDSPEGGAGTGRQCCWKCRLSDMRKSYTKYRRLALTSQRGGSDGHTITLQIDRRTPKTTIEK